MHQTKNHTAMSDASGAVLNLSSSPNAIYDQYFSLLGGMKLSSDVCKTPDVRVNGRLRSQVSKACMLFFTRKPVALGLKFVIR
eukprot:m.594892 g.594892  ORF g.594892 m.594892 type:complete len:83 (-) comp22399_c1_seq19:551-799(-)